MSRRAAESRPAPAEFRRGGTGTAPRESTRGPAIPFGIILLFGLYLVVGNFTLLIPWIDRAWVTPWTEANASAAAMLATALGQDTYANGTSLMSTGGSLSVKKGCNGIEAFVILVSAVLASPVPFTRRLVGVVLGAVAIFGFNIIRLVNLLFVAVHYPRQLDLFHIFIWQTLIVLIAFAVYMVWGATLAKRS